MSTFKTLTQKKHDRNLVHIFINFVLMFLIFYNIKN